MRSIASNWAFACLRPARFSAPQIAIERVVVGSVWLSGTGSVSTGGIVPATQALKNSPQVRIKRRVSMFKISSGQLLEKRLQGSVPVALFSGETRELFQPQFSLDAGGSLPAQSCVGRPQNSDDGEGNPKGAQ